MAAWRLTPEAKRSKRERDASPVYRAKKNAWRKQPEQRKKATAYMQRPDQRQKQAARNKKGGHEARNRWRRNKLRSDPSFAIETALRRRVCRAFQMFTQVGKVLSSDEYGISYDAIVAHLGPCPGDREKFHIDHVRPLCSFDLTIPAQVREAFAPQNHRWLPIAEHRKKSAHERRRYYAVSSSLA